MHASSSRRTLLEPALALAVLLALLLAVAAEASPYRLAGPRHVIPGEVVTYTVRGFAPGLRMALTVEPTRCGAPTCRYGDGNKVWLPNRDGVARVKIRWPETAAEGRGAAVYASDDGDARLVPWKRGSLARVRVCGLSARERCVSGLVRIR